MVCWSLQPDSPQGRHLVWPIMASNITVAFVNFKYLGFWGFLFFPAPFFFYLPSAPTHSKAFPYDLRKREIFDFGCRCAPCDFQFRLPSLGLRPLEKLGSGLGDEWKILQTAEQGRDSEHHMRRSQGNVAESVARSVTDWSHHPMASMKPHCGRREAMPVPGTLRHRHASNSNFELLQRLLSAEFLGLLQQGQSVILGESEQFEKHPWEMDCVPFTPDESIRINNPLMNAG